MSSDYSKFPFYTNTMDKKRSTQIIKETKTAIKKMESLRPSTPFGRRLLQNQDQFSIYSVSRPSSSTSVKSLRYEQEEIGKVLNPSSKKFQKSTSIQEIKLEPIVTKPIICRRRSSNSSLRNKNEIEFSRFPPLKPQDQNSKMLSNNINEEPKKRIKDFSCEENKQLTEDNYSSKEGLDCYHPNESGLSEPENYSCNTHEDSNSEELETLSDDIFLYFPSLEKGCNSGNKKQVEEMTSIIKDLYTFLKSRNAFLKEFNLRTHLLKLLFQLLGSNIPDLSINIIHILLEMKVKDNNLMNIFRLVLKLLKDDCLSKNDDLLAIIKLIVESMLEISISTNKGATAYGLRILKQLVYSDDLKCELVEVIVKVINHHLKKFNDFFCMASEWDHSYNQVIVQFLTILHYLNGKETTREILIKCDSFLQILETLHCFYEHADIVQIAVRLISKFLDFEGCKYLVDVNEDLLLNFVYILEFHKYCIDIALQITFIIGNLVSANDKTAFVFLRSTNFINIMIDILDIYVNEHIQFKENVSECFRNLNSSGDSDYTPEIFEVVLKILSIWANICLGSEVGVYLASQEFLISHLLSVIVAYTQKASIYDTSFALYSFLVVIGNISYYIPSASDMCIITVENVIRLLEPSFSQEVRLESANIVRNLTRHQEVRRFIQEHSLLSEFINLLSTDDKEFNTSAYGIILNLLIDNCTHQMFYQEQGITRVLHKLHLCAERDWKTSSLMCQILWNYCNSSTENNAISKMEAQHLVKFLTYSIYKVKEKIGEEGTVFKEWKDEFCPVAQKLLHLLEARFIT